MIGGDPQFLQYLQGRTQTFNPYGAGRKVYGSGRSAPNIGPTSSPEGYRTRDMTARARRLAMLKRLKSGQQGRYMSDDYLRPKERF
jgi:hypothetical protein